MGIFSHASAGVYVKEIDLSQRVAAAATSIGAIVGPSSRGPLNERVLVTSPGQFLQLFGKPQPRMTKMHYAALAFLEESQRLYVTRVINDKEPDAGDPEDRALTAGAYCTVDDVTADAPIVRLTSFDNGASTPMGIYDPMVNVQFNPNQPGVDQVLFMVCAQNPGTWNHELSVRVRPSLSTGVGYLPSSNLVDFNPDYDDPFSFYVDVFENYRGPRQQPSETFLVSRVEKIDGFGNQTFIEEVINKRSNLIQVRNNALAPNLKIVRDAFVTFDGATNGKPVTAANIMRGWDIYRDPERVDVNILIQGSQPTYSPRNDLIGDIVAIQNNMADIAQQRMDCIAVLDVPETEQQLADAVAYRRQELNLDSSYAAIYTPDLRIYDRYNDIQLFVPPSGYVAAAYARTDYKYETWFAPAGMNRGDLRISSIREIYNLGGRDTLADSQINPVRFIPGSGYKIWGADTLQSMASALSNVNVRRLLNHIEKSISIAALYSVFNPHDEVLRAFLVDLCERFLQPIKEGRGLYWFKVVCDESNNPPEIVATGDLMLDIYVDPVIPAKRIHLNAIITKTGVRSFNEAIIANRD